MQVLEAPRARGASAIVAGGRARPGQYAELYGIRAAAYPARTRPAGEFAARNRSMV
jgi:hypothetical protein